MKETTYTVTALGRTFEFTHADTVLPFLTLAGRLVMGFFLIWSGFDKLITDFSAGGFLANASKGPLKDIFVDMGTNQTAVDVIDPLVIWGQILIGFSLILGLFTRVGAFFGALMMLMFYLAELWPEHHPFIDDRFIYIGILALLGALGAGRIVGIDSYIEQTETVKKMPWLKYLLG
jgi:thiosulfate dehydrogenase [quinone] large subunit